MKAVFLDRDDTIVKDPGFVRYEELEILPGAAEAVSRLNADYLVIVVTNQPVIARGILSEDEVTKINNALISRFAEKGARIDAVYFCPHHPEKHQDVPEHAMKYRIECTCRKPKTGMIEQACRDFDIDLGNSFVVGDSRNDIEMGKTAGCRTISLRENPEADYNATNVLDASRIIKPDITAIILAGGRGERLRPITDSIPKPMIPISGKPVLQHQIETLRNSGITDVVVCGSYLIAKIKDHFGSGKKFGVSIRYPDEPEQLGSGGAVRNAAGLLRRRFVIINGDKMIGKEFDFRKMIEFDLRKKPFATILVRDTDHPLDSDIIRLNNSNRVIEFIGRGQDRYTTSNSGIIIAGTSLIDVIPGGKSNIEKDVLFRLLDEKEIYGFVLPGEWFVKDMGTPERLAAVRQRFEVS